MIKIFTGQYYSIENDVNEWLKENQNTGKIEVTKITQSSCNNLGDREEIYVTVMIEYIELITNFGYPSLDRLST
jgi:hypothetical protein